MAAIDWHKQSTKPSFEDILWSRPLNRSSSGKLLIIGGSTASFAAVAQSFSYAKEAGAGTIRLLLPESLRRIVGSHMPEAEFAPSTQNGSFSREAVGIGLASAEWADTVLLTKDFGKNSETSIFLERFIAEYNGPLFVTHQSARLSTLALERSNTTLITTTVDLQPIAAQKAIVLSHSEELMNHVLHVHELQKATNCTIISLHNNYHIVAAANRVSTTSVPSHEHWVERAGSYSAVLSMQFPSPMHFEALTTAAWLCNNPTS